MQMYHNAVGIVFQYLNLLWRLTSTQSFWKSDASPQTISSVVGISPGHDLGVLWRLGVPSGVAGAGWGGHHLLRCHRHVARKGRGPWGPEQLLQHRIRPKSRETPAQRPTQVCICECTRGWVGKRHGLEWDSGVMRPEQKHYRFDIALLYCYNTN